MSASLATNAAILHSFNTGVTCDINTSTLVQHANCKYGIICSQIPYLAGKKGTKSMARLNREHNLFNYEGTEWMGGMQNRCAGIA